MFRTTRRPRARAAICVALATLAGVLSAAAADGVRIQGSTLLLDDQPFVPLGFTMVGLLSPTMTGTAGTAGDHYNQAEIDAAKSWGANTFRFQISQRGFDPQDALHTTEYIDRVKAGVALARANGFVVILSMQDQSYSGGDATPMPEPQTLRSWDEVTANFNGDPYIMYELFNEPMVKDSDAEWQLWLNGGTLDGQTVIGHQELVNRVRASGATNVLIAEPTRVGKSFVGFPGLADPQGQLAFGIHPYLGWLINDPASWDHYFGDFADTHVVVATEWNVHSYSPFVKDNWPTLAPQLLAYLKSKDIGLTAWAFDIVDTLIQDWNWTPTTLDGWQTGVRGCGAGELVKAHFLSYGSAAAAAEVYNHYFGNTHSHTIYSDGAGTPAEHFALAKQTGFDFYAISDHALAKYAGFTPASYEDSKTQANAYTDSSFVGMAGFEFSENDGPDGKGHTNTLNSASYLDATGPSVGMQVYYDWLVNDQTTVTASSFNHPGTSSYNSFAYLTDARRDEMTMLEMINSGNLHYGAFLAALNKGWRVAPMAALDNHGLWRVTNHFYRTGVLAPSLTRANILAAMRARRVYATWDQNLRVTVRANGEIMGSVLYGPTSLGFAISVSDPDTGASGDTITKIEVHGHNGAVVASQTFDAHSVTWNPSCAADHAYYFCSVHAADKTDGPTAYSAPFWIEAGGTPQPPAPGPGTGILREVWNGVAGDAVSDLTSDARFPDAPDVTETIPSFEGPTDAGDEYGSRLRGTIVAPLSGQYVFNIAADDNARLLVNGSGSDPAGAVAIASVPGWTNPREWTKYPEQTSGAITLTAGQRYYVEVLHKEGTGGDNVAVRWSLPSGATEAPIPGHRLDPYVPPEPEGPYGGTPRSVPGRIEAEDYDTGGEGVAYHDDDAGNTGGAYRTDDVDVEVCAEGGHSVGWIAAGEWLQYTVNVESSNTYDIKLRVASESAGGTVRVLSGGSDLTGAESFTATGGWQEWTTVTIPGVALGSGVQELRLHIDASGFNLNWIELLVAGGEPSDGDEDDDGLPDDWELEQFGDLDEVGTGDADDDGATNLEEYDAGTDPNSADSVPVDDGPAFSCVAGAAAHANALLAIGLVLAAALARRRRASGLAPVS